MEYYAGIAVSLECSSVCVMDGSGKFVREAKVASEPEALIGWFGLLGLGLERIGLEAGPLSQWLYAAMREAGGSTRRPDGSQAGADQASGRREQPARDLARLRAEGRQDHPTQLCRTHPGAGRWPAEPGGDRRGAALGACRSATRVQCL